MFPGRESGYRRSNFAGRSGLLQVSIFQIALGVVSAEYGIFPLVLHRQLLRFSSTRSLLLFSLNP